MPCRRTISATFSGGTTLGGGTVGASAGGLFEHATEPAERIERLVREVFAIYERGAAELRAIRREGDVHPRVAQDRDEFEASLSALVDTALEPLGATQHDRAVARAMVDLNTWEALRVQGLGPAESAAAIGDMLAGRVASGRAVPSSGSSRPAD